MYRFVTPLDAQTVMYVASADDGSGPWLWSLGVEQKLTRRATSGLERYTSVAAAADGRRLVATVANPSTTLWSVPILDRVADERDVKPYAVPTVRALAPRFGPGALFFMSSTGAGDGLWRSQGDQALEIWKGVDGPLFVAPDVSPDGTPHRYRPEQSGKLSVAYRLGRRDRFATAGATRSTCAARPRGRPTASGSSIAGKDASGNGLFKIPLDGGPAARLLAGTSLNPVWSPDGNLIVYTGPNVANEAPLLAIRPDGTPVELPATGVRGDTSWTFPRHRFLPDGKRLVYMQGASAWQDFWLLDVMTMQRRQLTRLSSRAAMRSFDITPDGRQIVFDRSQPIPTSFTSSASNRWIGPETLPL